MVYSVIYSMIFIYAVSCSSASSCGKPGHSRRSVPTNTDDRQVFAEGFAVQYLCEGLLIGDDIRKCENSRWSGSIPKCSEPLDSAGISAGVVATTEIDFKWKTKLRIVGLRVGLRRPSNQSIWPEIGIDGDSDLSLLKVRVDDSIHKSFRLIHLSFFSPDVRYLGKLDQISVKTRNQIADCSNDADSSLVRLLNGTHGLFLCFSEGWYWLYHLDENVDDCDTPDTPVNVRRVSTFRSGTILHARYECEKGYRFKMSQAHESPTCSENGDWTAYDFRPCEKIFCNRDETEFVIVSVDQSAAHGSHFPIGTKGFLSCSTLQEQRYVVCAENGAWLPATELCGTPFFKNDGLVIGLVVTLAFLVILVPIIGFWLHYRARSNATDIKIQTKRHDNSANNDVMLSDADYEARKYEPLSYEYVGYDNTENPAMTPTNGDS